MVVLSNPSGTLDKRSRLTAFRQDLYDCVLTKRRDAQQELLDALMLSPPVHSFPELSLTPAMERQWHSLYKALEQGEQDETTLTEMLSRALPPTLLRLHALDESAWPRPDARTLKDRAFIHRATVAIDGAGIVVGHSSSVLAYCALPGTSWTLPLSCRRVPTTSGAVEVGAAQVKELYRACADKMGIDVVTADGRYGNHRFLRALRIETERGDFGVLARWRSDRVLYGEPGPYSGRGRPRKHGEAFRFKDETTWPAPQEYAAFTDPCYGEVELRLWQGLHAREDAETTFSVLRATIHLEREKPPKPLWLAWRGPALPPEELWRAYQRRATVEASFRFRKQYLASRAPSPADDRSLRALDAPGHHGSVDALPEPRAGARRAAAVAARAGASDAGACEAELREPFLPDRHAGPSAETSRKVAGVARGTTPQSA